MEIYNNIKIKMVLKISNNKKIYDISNNHLLFIFLPNEDCIIGFYFLFNFDFEYTRRFFFYFFHLRS